MEEALQYLKRMSLSIVMMILLAYGMATNNPWLQPLYIMVILFALQIGYQLIRTVLSRKNLQENVEDASHIKKGVLLFKASEVDVIKAKGRYDEENSMGSKMFIMLLAPLAIFLGSAYLLGIIFPGIEQWKSYVISFLLTMPVNTILTIKMGLSGTTTAATPKSYVIGRKGIAFDHLSQSFLLRFPLTKLEVQKDKNLIEVTGKAEAPMIPNRLKLFTEKTDQLNKILAKHLPSQEI